MVPVKNRDCVFNHCIEVNISWTTVALCHQDKFGFWMECRASPTALNVPNADPKKKEKGNCSNTEIIIEEVEVYWTIVLRRNQ